MKSVQKVADYEVGEPLGTGPIGTVYKAYDHEQGREVALRIMSTEVVRWDTGLRSRFQDEGRAIVALKHPNIAEWYEIGEHGDSMYVAAELIAGQDLKHFILNGMALPIEKKIGVMHQVSAALAHAHNAGVLHRDIRPANVFLQPDGVAKIADFGLASMTSGLLLKAAVRWGTPLYLCPEQIRHKSYDARSEIFAAGTVFYEFLTGAHPFQHSNSNRVLDDIASEEHLPSFEPLSDAPAGLCSIVARCLAKDPDERFASMSEVEDALVELVEDVAKECQAMLVELQIATHRLKRAAAVREAPPQIEALAQGIRQLLGSDHKRDYASLDRLMATLAEQSAVVHALTKGPARRQRALRPLAAMRPEPSIHEDNRQVTAAKSSESAGQQDGQQAPVVPTCEDPMPGEPAPALAQVCSPECEGRQAEPPPITAIVQELAPTQPEENRQESLEPLDARELQYLQVMMAELQGSVPSPSGEVAQEAQPQEAPRPEVPPIVETQALVLCPVVPPVILARKRPRMRTMAAAAALVGMCIALPFLWQNRATLSGLVRWGLRSTRPAPLTSPAIPMPQQSYEPAIDVLLREARLMAEQGRPDASRVFLQRALDLEPGNGEAKALLAELAATTVVSPASEDPLRQQVLDTFDLIAAGQLRKARTEIARIAAVNPDHHALPGLRKSLEEKNAESSRDAARKKAEQAEAVRGRTLADETWSQRAGELYRAGKYAELPRLLDQWALASPGSSQLSILRTQAVELQQLFGSFQSALSDRRYADAAVALARVESLNPSDPVLPELKRLLESKKAAALGRLTVLRLSDPGVVLLDATPIGHAGEVHGAPVSIGEHILSVKLPGGTALTAAHDFRDGGDVSFVYDANALRPMKGADLELAAARKAREQTHRFMVEHPHGVLRGSCKGELLVNGFDVKYLPQTGSHGFQIPFSRLNIRIDGRVIELRFASDNTGFQSFRIRDGNDAEALKQTWAKLRQAP